MRSRPVFSSCSAVILGRPFFVVWALVLAVPPVVPEMAHAQEPPTCENAVAEADTHFQFGRFREASTLLEACLIREAFSEDDRPSVYELLAQIYEANGQMALARTALTELLSLIPGYEPDPAFPTSFKDLVHGLKSERAAAEPDDPSLEAPPSGPVVEVTPASTHGEDVRNVRLWQEGDWLVITYDLVGTAKKYAVRLLLSTDGGLSYEALPQTVTGQVGEGLLPGASKEMRWAVLQDYPQGLAGDQYRVQVTARKQKRRGLLYVLGGALVAGSGATVALLLGGGDDGGNSNGDADAIPAPPGRPPGN